MEYNLSLALCDSMSNEAKTIATSLLEVGLDAVMDDGILKEVPILSTAVSLYKIGTSIKERHQVKILRLLLWDLIMELPMKKSGSTTRVL